MDAACGGVDKGRQGVDIGGQQFADSPQFQYLVHQRMTVAQLEQDVLGRAILARLGFLGLRVDFQMVEQHFAHLCRRCRIEGHAG